MYAQQVRRYMDVFPADQLHISLFEEAQRDPRGWFSGILEFLGVDPTFAPEGGRGHYHPNVPKFVRVSQTLQARGLWKALGQCVPKGLQPAVKRIALQARLELHGDAGLEDLVAELVEILSSPISKSCSVLLQKDLAHWLWA